MHQKLVSDPSLIWYPNKPSYARNSFKNKILKEDYQKALKFILFFLSNQVPFNGQSYQKQKSPGTSEQSLFSLQNKFGKIPLLVIYYLTNLLLT